MITNMGELRRAHKNLLRNTRAAIDAALEDAGVHAKYHAEVHAQFKHRSGAVKRGTRSRVRRLKSGAVLRITNPVKHAKFLEWGTRPHVITARRGFLRFYWMRMGKQMTIRKVNHPGTKATWFLKNATHSAYNRAGLTLRKSMKRHAAKF